MCRVIVDNQMQVQVSWGLLINQFQKLDPFLMAMTIHTCPNDAPFGHFQSGEQGRGPVAFVVVGHRSQSSFNQGQTRLGSVQGLNRCLFISAQDQRMLGRVQIQAHHIDHFVSKLFVSADFERLGQMGFKTTGLPNPVHHRFIDAQLLGQCSDAPVGGMRRLTLRSRINNRRGQLFSLLGLSTASRQILFNSRQALLDKPSPPARHLATVHSQKLGDRFVLLPLRRHQHDLGSLHQAGRCSPPARPTRQAS